MLGKVNGSSTFFQISIGYDKMNNWKDHQNKQTKKEQKENNKNKN